MANTYFNYGSPVVPGTRIVSARYNQDLSSVAAAFDLLPASNDLFLSLIGYGAASGSTPNVYNVTIPTGAPLTSYVTGMQVTFLADKTSTGAIQLNVNGLGNKLIVSSGNVGLPAGSVIAGSYYTVRYDGTNFQMQTALYALFDLAAQQAAASAAAAAVSESNALAYANQAAASRSAAAASASSAATSETNALAYASTAQIASTSAVNSANAAAASEANALAYRNAAQSAQAAASGSATNAATSATNASNSAQAAATSATNAANSATTAQNIANNLGILSSFGGTIQSVSGNNAVFKGTHTATRFLGPVTLPAQNYVTGTPYSVDSNTQAAVFNRADYSASKFAILQTVTNANDTWMEVIAQNANNVVTAFRMVAAGRFEMGSAVLYTNGNLGGSLWGGLLYDFIRNGYLTDSYLGSEGTLFVGNGTGEPRAPSGCVLTGVRTIFVNPSAYVQDVFFRPIWKRYGNGNAFIVAQL